MSNNEKRVSDNELINLSRNGNLEAAFLLLERYKGFSKGLASRSMQAYPESGIPFQDFVEEGIIAYYDAFKKYEDSKADSFYPYWLAIAQNKIFTLLRECSYQYGGKAFFGISLEAENKDGITYGSMLGEPDEEHIETLAEVKIKQIQASETMKELEKAILILRMKGYDHKEICKILKITKNTYYYYLKSGKEALKAKI